MKSLRNIKLTIEYNGTNYSGWQSQKNAISICDVVRGAIEKLTGEDIKLIGASRTDAGVHAFGQVANFRTASGIPEEKFSYAINSNLPSEIVIVNSTEVYQEFHSRFDAKGKTYIYKIYNRRFPSAIFNNQAYHVGVKLATDDMVEASKHFLGTHDFESFRAAGCTAKTAVRTISKIDVALNEDMIIIEICGDGFLYNMVRIIAGTLTYVGMRKIDPSSIKDIIESRDRKNAGKTAPAHGLFLKEIYY
jgi:tRNA pseudouridine38-40 synthase